MSFLLLAGSLAAAGAEVSFTTKPAAVREGEGARISFAVSAPTDVTVWIEDARGKIVRRLASGVLGGQNPPPAPLKPGLAQEIAWDGKADLGKPAGVGPFRARVGLGLDLKYDCEALSDRLSLNRIRALAAGGDGMLYVVQGLGTSIPNYDGSRLFALTRNGRWGRMVVPPPAGLGAEQWKRLGAVPATVAGRSVPLFLSKQQRKQTDFDPADGSGAAVTPDGHLLTLLGGGRHPVSLGMVALDPARQAMPLAGPGLFPGAGRLEYAARAFVAVSSDGKHAYFWGVKGHHAVYRVRLPERTPAELFFGDPQQGGNDERHLSEEPGGLCADGKGHLLIADTGNNRVLVVAEADRKLVGQMAVERPIKPAVDPATGALYVLGGKGEAKSTATAAQRQAEIVKFPDWRKPEPAARVTLRSVAAYPRRSTWDMAVAVDVSAKPAVLWASDSCQILRIEDPGDTFADPVRVSVGENGLVAMGDASFVDVSVDRWRDPPEIYVRGGIGVNLYSWRRVDEATLKWETLTLPIEVSSGSCLLPGPDGNLYTPRYPVFLAKWDRNGKPLSWDAPFENLIPAGSGQHAKRRAGKNESNTIFSIVAMTFMTHTHGIRHDGHHFIFEARFDKSAGRTSKALHHIDPSGRRVGNDPVIWFASDSVQGPRFDPQGNLYVADIVRPLDQLVPPEFAELAGNPKLGSALKGEGAAAAHMYGSIMKFSPKGGAIEYQLGSQRENPYHGEMKLDPSLKAVDVAAIPGIGGMTLLPARVTGAEWVHFGISHVELTQCNCESVRFDVDWFGRVWYPDMGRYRVGVLDSNGNVIGHFGGYGNTESGGPNSTYPDPDLAFAYLVGVGATDRYAYMGDSINQRLLRARILYGAEEICPIP